MLLPLVGISAATAVAVLLCLYLFISLKAQIRAGERRAMNVLEIGMDGSSERLRELEDRVCSLEQTLRDLEQSSAAPVSASGINLTTRSQVLRRHRQGEDAAQIAAALGLPRTEVDLLLKVNRLVLEHI